MSYLVVSQSGTRRSPINHSVGATIGAAQLDSLFEKAVLERLQATDRHLPMGLQDLHQTAWEMRICKEYQYVFGDARGFPLLIKLGTPSAIMGLKNLSPTLKRSP